MTFKERSSSNAKDTRSGKLMAKVERKGHGSNRGSASNRDQVQKSDSQCVTIIKIELQQLVVNVFRGSFTTEHIANIAALFQEVKQHLFNRDFGKAFGSQEYLEAYAIRWSPSRALAYLEIFRNIPYLEDCLTFRGQSDAEALEQPSASSAGKSSQAQGEDIGMLEISSETQNASMKPKKVACLGGGAGAEMVALAGYVHHVLASHCAKGSSRANGSDLGQDYCAEESFLSNLTVTLVDIADWSKVVNDLYERTVRCPPVSKYAASAARLPKAPLVPLENFSYTFHQQDILGLSVEGLALILKDAILITIMFTLNELYSVSMAKTTNLLLAITYLSAKGTMLLVVDSPGSYSTVNVGRSGEAPGQSAGPQKQYPMQWLLDHTLLEASIIGSSKSTDRGRQWEKLVSEDSRWFRLPADIEYPVPLENMRYQMHLYRRL